MELLALDGAWFACRRRQIARRCCRNIAERWNVVWSIKILSHILHCCRSIPPPMVRPEHHHREKAGDSEWYCVNDDRSCWIEWLESEFHLQQNILSDLTLAYSPPSNNTLPVASTSSMLAAPLSSPTSSSPSSSTISLSPRSASPMGGSSSMTTDPSTLLEPREALHDRLQLLTFLGQWCSSVRLTFDNIRTVWNLFVTQPVCRLPFAILLFIIISDVTMSVSSMRGSLLIVT
jgi:hypothetical protein